ncbi:MAG: 50S ribosomal protein L21 [Actinomycetales bacterium]|nr:50S ribosomal protein L21 [Actinomycetales bacterium]
MYAVVRAGGRQERVGLGDEVLVDRREGEPGAAVDLPVLLLVDGGRVTPVASAPRARVTGVIVSHSRGPKIDILRYRNKTGYRRRQGHRQELTTIRITDISAGV